MTPAVPSGVIEAIVAGRHDDPFAALGPHDGPAVSQPTFARLRANAGNAGAVTALAAPAHGLPCPTTLDLPPLAAPWLVHEAP